MVRIKFKSLALFKYSILLLLAVQILSCSSIKHAVSIMTSPFVSSDSIATTHSHPEIPKAYPELTTFSAKFKLASETIKELNNLKGVVRIQRDSIVWLNISLDNGITVVKALFTPDSFKVYNRIEQELTQGTYADFSQMYQVNVDFFMLQSVFLNDYYPLYNPESTAMVEGAPGDSIRAAMDYSGKHNENLFHYVIDKVSKTIFQATIIAQDMILSIKYDKFDKEKHTYFPEDYLIQWQSADKKRDIYMELNRIEINSKVEFPFNIPNR